MAVQELSAGFACSLCGRPWSPGTDGKWPIRITSTDPPRAVSHCLACAEMGAGYEARWCAAGAHGQPLSVAHRNGSASVLTSRSRLVSRLRKALASAASS
jgi:hypothetical protein